VINRNKVVIDLSRDSLFDEMGLRRLRDSYMMDSEKSPQERFSYVARAFASDEEHAQRLYDYSSKHWLSFATPVLSYKGTRKGLPISCYLAFIADSAESLVETQAEVAYLSMKGGGVGIGVGIRSEDDKSVGVMPHLKTYEANSLAYRQGKTRRGSFAAYLDINHPNIVPFIDMRKSTGDPSQRTPELHHGINITDEFMAIIEAAMLDPDFDDRWELKDPHNNKVKEIVSAKFLWESIIETRMRTGEPYIHYIDASNRDLPEYQRTLGLSVRQSNICTEITLPTDAERTAVCCLSSPNLEYWDEWKDNELFYSDIERMLDNVLDVFIKNAPKRIKRAAYSAMQERAIGIGALGFHALLQKKSIAWEGAMAVSLNHQIFSRYRKYFDKINYEAALERGPCPDSATGKGDERHSCMTAIAPNASTSIVMGNTSASIEPYRANAYRQDTLSGSFLTKNKYLDAILMSCLDSKEYDAAWNSIVTSKGSCQHIECLTDHEKEVFKTATELDQMWLIEHAATRQPYLDQAQSLNLFFPAKADIEYLHHVHYTAWKKGLKSLYYCRSEKIYHGESMSKKVERVRMGVSKTVEEECLACQG
jgi:ribonucleoside-diphosphate reductase alpha chain